MKGKLVFVVGAAAGYVLGARAGRKRYEQIKAGAEKVWNTPAVQKGVDQVQGFVGDHVPDVQAAVANGAKKVVDQVAKRTTTKAQNSRSGATGSSAKPAGETNAAS